MKLMKKVYIADNWLAKRVKRRWIFNEFERNTLEAKIC